MALTSPVVDHELHLTVSRNTNTPRNITSRYIEPVTSCYNAVVTREIKLFQNYVSLRRRSSEIILPEIISKLFQRLIAAHEHFPTCSISLK